MNANAKEETAEGFRYDCRVVETKSGSQEAFTKVFASPPVELA